MSPASPKPGPKRADDLVNADGLFWRIDKPSLPPSYLFGTIHSTDDDALALARRAASGIPEAKVVATELGGPLDAVEKAEIGAETLARALDRDHDTFADAPAEDRPGNRKAGRIELGYPTEFAHHLKLWFLAILTATPACEVRRQALDLPEVDQFLAEQAKAAGVKVVALETPQEQLDAHRVDAGPRSPPSLLAVAARDPEMNDDVYVTLLEALPREPPRRDPGGRRRDRRHERERTRRRGRFAGFCSPGATRRWRSASRRSSRTAAPSSRSARCIFRAGTASSSGCGGSATR